MKTKILAIALGLMTSLPTLAVAAADADGGDRLQERFQRIDQNGDGRVTRDEADLASSKMFARLDTDGDGAVTKSEVDGKGGKRGGRRFDRVDADGDGQVTEAEFKDARLRWFEHVDRNGDGAITVGEMESARNNRGQQRNGSQD